MTSLSVVVPTFNIKDHIRETLLCIQNQTMDNIEIIIIDDNSTDGTLEILQEIAITDSRIVLHALPTNVKPGAARNIGLSLARAKYVTFADHDDTQDFDRYSQMVGLLEEHETQVCFSYAKAYNQNRDTTKLLRNIGLPAGSYSIKKHYDKVAYSLWAPWQKVYQRQFVTKNNLRFAEGNVYFDDVCFHAQMVMKLENFSIYPSYSYTHRVFEGAISSNHFNRSQLLTDYTACYLQTLANVELEIPHATIASYFHKLLRKHTNTFDYIDDRYARQLMVRKHRKQVIIEALTRMLPFSLN